VKCDGGQEVSLKRPETITQKLQIMLRTDQYQEAAEAFSTRYADFQPQGQVNAMLGRVEELARR
jgi:Mg-chelatase subunit ChlI